MRAVLVAAILVGSVGWAGRGEAAGDEVVVFAASSLKEAFEGMRAGFETGHPGARVKLSFAGSQELRTQIEQGAQPDVYAAADLGHMAALHKAGLVASPRLFARNELVIVVPRNNPAGIQALADLPRTRRLVVGAPEVPVGRYTARMLDAAGKKLGGDFRAKVERAIASRELNVRQVLAKVTLGEADAGVVYRTDALAAKDQVRVVTIPSDLETTAEYPIAVLSAAPNKPLAAAFVELVLSAEGQRRLAAAGFLPVTVAAQVPAR
jgi:molybdate transport system substrate-binding protein